MGSLDPIPARPGTELLEMGGTQQQLLMLANQSLFPDDLPGLDAWKTSHHEWGTLLQQGIRNRNIGVEEHKLSNN